MRPYTIYYCPSYLCMLNTNNLFGFKYLLDRWDMYVNSHKQIHMCTWMPAYVYVWVWLTRWKMKAATQHQTRLFYFLSKAFTAAVMVHKIMVCQAVSPDTILTDAKVSALATVLCFTDCDICVSVKSLRTEDGRWWRGRSVCIS